MTKHAITLLLAFLTSLPLRADVVIPSAPAIVTTRPEKPAAACPIKPVAVERLANLNVARHNHFTLCVDGVPMVFGGHANGFKPTATAEYYSDGSWHLLDMVYTHDDGLVLPLSSGRVLLAGGHEKDLGIGQIYSVEMFDPATRTFEGFGCLDTRRVIFGAVEVDSGRVVISGNWYHDDGIEIYDGNASFSRVKAVSQQRSQPFMFRSVNGDALIFGSRGTHMDEYYDTIIVDRLHGEPFSPELFRQWKPLSVHWNSCSEQSRIGDYTYLLPVADSTGQVAIAKVLGEHFSLLRTDYPIPMAGLNWLSPVIADRQAQRAYLVGTDKGDDIPKHRFYILSIDYATTPARLTLLYADRPSDVGFSTPVLTADGDLLMAGGNNSTNFKPCSSALLFRVGGNAKSALMPASFPWLWLVLGVLIAVFVIAIIVWQAWRRSHRSTTKTVSPHVPSLEPYNEEADDVLMQRICDVMKREKLFLDSGLKVSDVADRLGVRSRLVSDCIKQQRDCLFSQFVNTYRVEYAQQLIRNYPDIKMTAVWAESGFSHEATFFRIFKSIVGMTPKEWIANLPR